MLAGFPAVVSSDQLVLRGRSTALSNLLGAVLSRGSKEQSEAVARWLVEASNRPSDPDEVGAWLAEAVTSWSHADRQAAVNFIVGLPPDDDKSSPVTGALEEICARWGESDPRSALAWAKTLPDADPRKVTALEGTFGPFNEYSLDEAKACVEQLCGKNKAAPILAAQVAGRLTRLHSSDPDGPQVAVQWVLSLPGVPERHDAMKTVTDVWIESSTEGLPQVVPWATALSPDHARGAVWVAVVEHWALFDSSGRMLGSAEEFQQRIKTNLPAVDNWLRQLPEGTDRDEAVAVRNKMEASSKGPMMWR